MFFSVNNLFSCVIVFLEKNNDYKNYFLNSYITTIKIKNRKEKCMVYIFSFTIEMKIYEGCGTTEVLVCTYYEILKNIYVLKPMLNGIVEITVAI